MLLFVILHILPIEIGHEATIFNLYPLNLQTCWQHYVTGLVVARNLQTLRLILFSHTELLVWRGKATEKTGKSGRIVTCSCILWQRI